MAAASRFILCTIRRSVEVQQHCGGQTQAQLQKPAAATGSSSVESFSVHEPLAVTSFPKLWRGAKERAVAKEEERAVLRK
ncbi:hypothetical protein Q7C36_001819 [Tachysurus vachellii]|uniref:Uncharacterized protein n=1 Tax=Tachysurus vachellii TaxID=175792 RepID=A0AA88NRS9_TACVA|nr:hypothetical protein Q7C36_001819 [Tachysurus vachellii]